MSFLAPAFLFLAAAAAVPLLVHLLRRRMDVRVDFPAARYLARAERENSRKLRLRNLLLMMLRVLVVLLITAAAAGPLGRIAGTGHAPTAVAVVLDNTLSTSAIREGRPVLERLKDAARAAISASSPSDQVWLVTGDGTVTGGNAAAVTDAVDRVRPLAGAGAIPAAVARATALLDGSPVVERRLGILTDGQPTTWGGRLEAVSEVPVLVLAPRYAAVANRAVVLAHPRPTRWTPRGELVGRLSSIDSASYRVLLGERTLARGIVAPGEEILVRAAPPERGWLAGTLELQPDELRADDVRFFAVFVGSPPGVRLGATVGPFVTSAVDALIENGRIARGSSLAVVAADELTTLPALILPPSDPVRLGAANRALERAGVAWRLGPLRRGSGRVRSGDSAWDSVSVTALQRHALASAGDASADTIAVVDGQPWIVAGDGYVLIASPIDPAATSLPVQAAFVPWLADMLTQRLGGGEVIESVPAASIRRPTWADAIEGPEGARLTLTGSTFAAPDRSGVHFLLRGGERVGAVVVNGETAESELGRLDDEAIAARFPGGRVSVASDSQAWVRSIFAAADRRPLIVPFLGAALLALVAESVIAGAGGRRTE
jgi:hypothetical protein